MIGKAAMYFIGLIVFIFSLLVSGAGVVCAATQTLSANIAFETVLGIYNATGINFGYVKADQIGTYTITPKGVVTTSNGGVVLGGASKAGGLTIAGSTSQAIDISVINYVANNGVTPSNATCIYNDGVASSCNLTNQAAPGDGKDILVGVTVDVDGQQTASTSASPTFDLVITYH